ncbi:DUF2252 family protein [Polyangium fumosum]|uniref:DUF2252 domain-containing protein n=1 Tax=Polyangium fumosum TaxID=889272 RepID=A0A4U1J1T1_9BACT|nr:DUF2252 domain-containing protein [Polyangium fumosum]
MRQLRDWKFSVDVAALDRVTLTTYGSLCGWPLARAHARSGDLPRNGPRRVHVAGSRPPSRVLPPARWKNCASRSSSTPVQAVPGPGRGADSPRGDRGSAPARRPTMSTWLHLAPPSALRSRPRNDPA